jgi:predicted PurR-regulated permease PerM
MERKKKLTMFQITATVAAGGALALCIVFVLWRIVPGLLWAFVLAIALWPTFVRVRAWNKKASWHRFGAPFALTVFVGLIVATPIAFAAMQILRESQSLLGWINDARQHGVPIPAPINQLPWIGGRVLLWWQENLLNPEDARTLFREVGPGSLLGLTRNLGPELLHRALLFGVTLLTLFFLFKDGEGLWSRFLALAEKAFGERGRPIAGHVIDAIHGTVDGLVFVGLAEGLIIGIGYWVTGVPHAMAFAIATCILATIPFGAPLIFCFAALLLLGAGKMFAAMGLVGFGFLIVFATDHVVRPIVIGGATQIPFLLVLLGILGGLSSLGLVGLFVGPALMAVFVAVWRDLAVEVEP